MHLQWPKACRAYITSLPHTSAVADCSLLLRIGDVLTVCQCGVQALAWMHNPLEAANLEAAKQRMAFEELFLLQLKLLLRREVDRAPRNEDDAKGIGVRNLGMMIAGSDALGFKLTPAQDRVLKEVIDWFQLPCMMPCCKTHCMAAFVSDQSCLFVYLPRLTQGSTACGGRASETCDKQ